MVFRLTQSVKAVMGAVVFCQLLMCATISAVQLHQLESNDVLSVDCFISFYRLLVNLTLTFVYCYLSESVSISLNRVGDIFFNLPWYRLSAQQKKLTILTIQRSHGQFYFDGFGVISVHGT